MNSSAQPFVKWAGGKRKITELLKQSIPPDFFNSGGNFFEPFVGGGALTIAITDSNSDLSINGDRIAINDMNPDLIATYELIRDEVDILIEHLTEVQKDFLELPLPEKNLGRTKFELEDISKAKNRGEYYSFVRSVGFGNTKLDIAKRFIFLNKTCFNGLWRVNSEGKFNVPFGYHSNPSLFDEKNLLECNRRFSGIRTSNSEFIDAVSGAKSGDFVYFDPPYIPLNPTSSFSQYSKNDFGLQNQIDLAKTIEDLTSRGVKVILSNSDTPQTREIFGGIMNLKQISMSRAISASADSRKPVYEVLGTNFEIISSSPLSSLASI